MAQRWTTRRFWATVAGGIFLFTTLSGSGEAVFPETANWANWTLEELARAYPTPRQLAGFLRRTIAFKRDPELFSRADYWQTPEELLARRAGDCEDYALLAKAVLDRQGKEAFLLSLYGSEGYAHTVCVFVEQGRYNVINQDRLVRYRAKSLDELAGFLHPGWSWAAIAVQHGSLGKSIRKIQNPSPASAAGRHDFGNVPYY